MAGGRRVEPPLRLDAAHVHDQAPRVRRLPVLGEEDALPGTQHQPPAGDRDGLGGAGDGGPPVRGHVVGAPGRVRVAPVAAGGQALALCYPDGRRYTFDAATVRGAARRPAWVHITQPHQGLAAAFRTSFSAIWRGIEGAILDEAIHRIHALRPRGLRLVLPIYDGLLLQVPVAHATELADLVEAALHEAMCAVGLSGGATVRVASTWRGNETRLGAYAPPASVACEAAPQGRCTT